MSIFVKLKKYKNSSKSSFDKYYAQTVPAGEIHTDDLAETMCANTTFKPGEVKGLIEELVDEMKIGLQDGHVIVLDGFGRFQLVVQSEGVDDPKKFNLKQHIRKVACKFLPAGKRDKLTNKITRNFCDGVKVEWAK